MVVLALLAALVLAYVGRLLLARRARRGFCAEGCVTLAVRLNPKRKGIGWKHGYARLAGDVVEWRSEHRLKPGADMTFHRGGLRVREHRPVRKGETMLSDRCELMFGTYQGEEIELGVLQPDVDTVLGWARG